VVGRPAALRARANSPLNTLKTLSKNKNWICLPVARTTAADLHRLRTDTRIACGIKKISFLFQQLLNPYRNFIPKFLSLAHNFSCGYKFVLFFNRFNGLKFRIPGKPLKWFKNFKISFTHG
jgi:hypothetical protein